MTDWNSARDEGASAFDQLSNKVPFDKVKLEDFGNREKKLWDLLKNSPLMSSQIEMANLVNQEVEGLTKLNDDWDKTVRDSDAYYNEIQRQLSDTSGDLADFLDALKAVNKLQNLTGGG